MKLEKAIENNAILLKHDYWTMTPINFDSIKLGKEALEQLIKIRLDNKAPGAWTLPSETYD